MEGSSDEGSGDEESIGGEMSGSGVWGEREREREGGRVGKKVCVLVYEYMPDIVYLLVCCVHMNE